MSLEMTWWKYIKGRYNIMKNWSFLQPRESPRENKSAAVEAKSFSEIPGPKISYLDHCLNSVTRRNQEEFDFYSSMKELHRMYGPIVRIHELPWKDRVVALFDPNLVQKMYYEAEKGIPRRSSIVARDYYFNRVKKITTLSTGQDREWRSLRSQVQKYLLSASITSNYTARIDEVAKDMVKKIALLRSPEHEKCFDDFYKQIQLWSLETLAYIALDYRLGCLNLNLDSDSYKMHIVTMNLFHKMSELENKTFWKIIPSAKSKEFIKDMDYLMRIVERIVAQKSLKCKNEMNFQSVLDHMLANYDLATTTALMVDLLSAGIDTIANSVGRILFHLANEQDVQSKLREEIKSVLPSMDSSVNNAHRRRLPYLKAVIKESMRVLPTVPANTRTLNHDTVLGGYAMPKGTVVMAVHSLMSKDEKNFSEPERFLPERWLKNSKLYDKANPFTFQPFGHGSRRCVAKEIAEQEIEIFIARIIQNYKLQWKGDNLNSKFMLHYQIDSPLKFHISDVM